MGTKLRIALVTVAALALALFAFCEIGLAYPVSRWLYLAVAIALVVALNPIAPGRGQHARAATLLASWATIAALYLVPWTSRKPFLRALAGVKVGMTEAEVRQIMSRYPEGTGWPASPFDQGTNATTLAIVGSRSGHSSTNSPSGELVIQDSLVFRHSTEGAFNSDWGIVTFAQGRVTRVEFSPD